MLGGFPVTLAPAHEIMTGPNRDSQKCLQTLPSILCAAEWPPDENRRDFDLLLVIQIPCHHLEHLWVYRVKLSEGSSLFLSFLAHWCFTAVYLSLVGSQRGCAKLTRTPE